MVVTCAVTYATEQTFEKCCDLQQKPDKEIQEKEKECLQKLNTFLHTVITGQDLNDQLEAVYALQVFCHENEFPKGTQLWFLKTFFIIVILAVFARDVVYQHEKYKFRGNFVFVGWVFSFEVEVEKGF